MHFKGFPGGSDGDESACSAGHPSLIPGSGGFPGERNGNPLKLVSLPGEIHGQRLQLMGSNFKWTLKSTCITF